MDKAKIIEEAQNIAESLVKMYFSDAEFEGAEVDDLVDDAWSMGATHDTLSDKEIDLQDEHVKRTAYKAFEEAFLAYWYK